MKILVCTKSKPLFKNLEIRNHPNLITLPTQFDYQNRYKCKYCSQIWIESDDTDLSDSAY